MGKEIEKTTTRTVVTETLRTTHRVVVYGARNAEHARQLAEKALADDAGRKER